ncbi:hypothetical protein ACFX2I_032226 [Malus domestica]
MADNKTNTSIVVDISHASWSLWSTSNQIGFIRKHYCLVIACVSRRGRKRGVDMDAKDEDGYIALHCVMKLGHADVIEMLVFHLGKNLWDYRRRSSKEE